MSDAQVYVLMMNVYYSVCAYMEGGGTVNIPAIPEHVLVQVI